MSNHSEGSTDLSYQHTLSRGGTANSLFDKHSLAPVDGKLENYKHSMAYEKGLMKEKCGLCKMYFHRNSVNYKVPNHRIFDLERKWNVKRDGRRYTNPAFMYKMVDVCCFCAQFFKIMPDQLPVLEPKEPGPKPMKLDIKTVLERTDIACGQRTYMSSSVDGRTSDMAVLPPYEELARTRREVDPWWEIDFSRNFHVHSLSFNISTGKNQKLHVSVFLLDKPYGFEDPFIDSIKDEALASMTEVVPASPQSIMVPINWEFPAETTCFAIRIQLKGIHSLGIQNFKVLQGDNLVLSTEDDFVQTMVSYSSLSPVAVRQGYLDMMSPELKKELIREKDPYQDIDHKLKAKHVSVGVLAQQIKRRKARMKQWKEKVLQFASIFDADEIEALYKVIFKPAYECKPGKDLTLLNESELLDNALIQHYPRCDLTELQTRLRAVTRWIQTRSHLKTLGALANSHNFDIVSNDPNHHIYHLSLACKRVEIYWGKHELQEERELEESQDMGFNGTKASEARGCSWSQFLILISLFLTQRTKSIPDEAFFFDSHTAANVGHYHSRGGDNFSSLADDHSLVSDAPGSLHNLGSASLASSVGGNAWLDKMATSVRFNPPEVVVDQKTLLQQAREVELFPYYNSSFAEYKFWHFQRRTELNEIDFPPDLSLEFARTLNPKRASTSHSTRTPLPALENAPAASNTQAPSADGYGTDDNTVRSSFSRNSSPEQLQQFRTNGKARLNAQRSLIWTAPPGEPAAFTGAPMKPSFSEKVSRSMKSIRVATMSPSFSASTKLVTNKSSKNLLQSEKSSKNLLQSASLTSLDGGSSTMSLGQMGSQGSPPSRPNTSNMRNTTSTPSPSRPTTRERPKSKPAPLPMHDDHSITSQDLMSFGDSSKGPEPPAPLTTIDFFRVCALCEVKFPRDCMDVKVMRKHVVNLRMSWDPALVSKEIRLLDHTISMYSLVHVCTFCSQFFDPDFPDGIAYPVRVDSPIPKTRGPLQAIASQSLNSPLIKYYDTRYVANPIEVGEVFSRPKTVDARARAQRALAISTKYNARQAEILLASTQPVKK